MLLLVNFILASWFPYMEVCSLTGQSVDITMYAHAYVGDWMNEIRLESVYGGV